MYILVYTVTVRYRSVVHFTATLCTYSVFLFEWRYNDTVYILVSVCTVHIYLYMTVESVLDKSTLFLVFAVYWSVSL